MASVAPHVHISGLDGIINALFVITVFGTLMTIAKRKEGHPLADAFLEIF